MKISIAKIIRIFITDFAKPKQHVRMSDRAKIIFSERAMAHKIVKEIILNEESFNDGNPIIVNHNNKTVKLESVGIFKLFKA